MSFNFSFSPADFNFIYGEQMSCWVRGGEQTTVIYENIDSSSGNKIYKIQRDGEQIYIGFIPTNVFAEKLFKNLCLNI